MATYMNSTPITVLLAEDQSRLILPEFEYYLRLWLALAINIIRPLRD